VLDERFGDNSIEEKGNQKIKEQILLIYHFPH
jgi:hypothetical protein